MRQTIGIAALGAALLGSLSPVFAAGVMLVPHRAVYDLELADQLKMTDEASAMTGRMVYEFTGGACEGYTVNFRFVVETTDADGSSTVTDLRTSNHEDAPGKTFQFLSQTYTNEVLTEDVKGKATRGDKGLEVELASPAPGKLAFNPSVIFPTDHLERIIEAAQRGDRVVGQDVYDGSDGGSKFYRTATIIGPAATGGGSVEEKKIGELRHWPVTVSYFDAAAGGDQTPEYSISFDLWENGVSSDMRMDYGDFSLSGKLARYEPLPETKCE